MFDLKFMTSVFFGKGEDDASEFSNRREQVLDALESCIDPFDLDVFTPYIATNLNRQLQRCGVCVEIQTLGAVKLGILPLGKWLLPAGKQPFV